MSTPARSPLAAFATALAVVAFSVTAALAAPASSADRTVTATASNGTSGSWYTDSSGYADVYPDANPGDTVKVTVGAATCSTRT